MSNSAVVWNVCIFKVVTTTRLYIGRQKKVCKWYYLHIKIVAHIKSMWNKSNTENIWNLKRLKNTLNEIEKL